MTFSAHVAHETEKLREALQELCNSSKALLEECYQADAKEENSIDGKFFDAVRDSLIGASIALSESPYQPVQGEAAAPDKGEGK